MRNVMTVAALQMDISWENKPANYATVGRLLQAAAPSRESLVVLPEMFATGFSMNATQTAEPYGGETERFLSCCAQEFGIFLVAGAAMRGKDGAARNKALVFNPEGRLLAYYAKMRLFSPGGEADHYTAGSRVACFQWNSCRVAPFVCYDLRFPELFREAAAAHQPELFLVMANFPAKRIHHWTRLLQARAIENQAYVVGVNRVGKDPFSAYNGHSIIVDPQGEILAHAGESECFISAELDLEILRTYREKMPFLKDLRG